MTNRSARALKALAKACTDENAFGQWVDHLYYLIYEGTGACRPVANSSPGYAMDVKFLAIDPARP